MCRVDEAKLHDCSRSVVRVMWAEIGGPMTDLGMPETRYAHSGDINIAYQTMGHGPLDIVIVPGSISYVEFHHELPGFTAFLHRLSGFARVVTFDKRGQGLSDRVSGVPSLEERMDDVRAVMDAVGSKRAILLGFSEGCPMSVLFAATYPERVSHLILVGGYANSWRTDEAFEAFVTATIAAWGTGLSMKRVMTPEISFPVAGFCVCDWRCAEGRLKCAVNLVLLVISEVSGGATPENSIDGKFLELA